MSQSDKKGFIHLGHVPKDTFLTKLDREDEDVLSENSSLFPIPSPLLSSTKVFNYCIKIGKYFSISFLIVGLLLTLTSFHFRLSALEHGLEELSSKTPLPQTWAEFGESVGTSSGGSSRTGGERNPIRVKRKVDHERHSQSQRSLHSSSRSSSGGGGGHSGGSSAHVEFMYPRTRDQPGASQDESSSTSLGNNSDSVLLTSFSRIPLMAIQDFCSKTKDYCPAGPPGPIGLPGVKGERGERGDVGDRGPRGPLGPTGAHGLRGPKGESGNPGVEGRDGLPGEPGLDGVPGRNGVDGIPGLEGMPGRAGRDGRNGTDGRVGPQGPKGDVGVRGLPGLIGGIGPSGRDGVPGIPGVNTTVISGSGSGGVSQVNTTIFIPPSIMGSEAKMRPLIVMEGETVRMGCQATGSPRPMIKWTREDGYPIRVGASVSYSAVNEPLLNFTKVNRIHMGKYVCYADNAVTPSASKIHELHVNFPPMIHVKNQQIGVVLGKIATLECEVEAFPRGATSWQTSEGKFITSNDTKYQTSTSEYDLYRVRMVLTVTRTVKADLGLYYCIAKNTFGIVKGLVTLGEWTSSQPTPPPHFVIPTGPGMTYGKKQPELEEESDLCPPPPPCPTCSPRIDVTKCIPSGYQLIDKFAWDVSPLEGHNVPDDKNRTLLGGCQLSAVGKPVFHGEFKHNGSWMREAFMDAPESEKYFKTRMEQTNVLYEYQNKTTFSNDQVAYAHNPIHPHFQGNFHTIYNGSFFYVAGNSDPSAPLKIIKYSLTQRKPVAEIELPYSSGESSPLYSPRSPESTSKVDLAVDENGLWAIYALPGITNTVIVKIEDDERDRLEIVFGWNITISHKHAGDMWIICGVLYAVDSVRERDTKIRLGLDLYRKKLLKIDLPFTNPFKQTTMVSYNPRAKQLLTLDDGNLLVYPVKHSALVDDDP